METWLKTLKQKIATMILKKIVNDPPPKKKTPQKQFLKKGKDDTLVIINKWNFVVTIIKIL